MKNIILIFLLLFPSISLFSQYPFGDSINNGLTAETAYQLWTLEHLEELRDSLGDRRYNAVWCTGKHFRLMQDIEDTLRTPIAKWRFDINLHGAGHRIVVGITVPIDAVRPEPYLVYYMDINSTIDSLIVDGYIHGGYSASWINGNAGTISHCINNATMIDTNYIYGAYTAGFVTTNFGSILHCINNGNIIGGLTSGIVFRNDLSANPLKKGVVGCINTGTVFGLNGAAGIVGLNFGGPITNCTNHGFVKGNTDVGGILEAANNRVVNISDCINMGVVVGNGNVGCIVGERGYGNTITNCYYDKQMCGEKY